MSRDFTRAASSISMPPMRAGTAGGWQRCIDDDVDFVILAPPQVLPFAGHHQGKGAVLRGAWSHRQGLFA